MATVQDELDFENLPQEIKDLVNRLYGERIEILEAQVEIAAERIKELEKAYE